MPCATTEQGKGPAQTGSARQGEKEPQTIILGLVLLAVGILTGISILTTIGVILMVVGAILWILGASGRAVGGRPHYW